MERVKRLWRRKPILLVAFAASIVLFVFFGFKVADEARLWKDPSYRAPKLEPWMTPRYVSLSYKIPQEDLLPALGLEPVPSNAAADRPRERITLNAVAIALGIDFDELEELIEDLAEEARERSKASNDD